MEPICLPGCALRYWDALPHTRDMSTVCMTDLAMAEHCGDEEGNEDERTPSPQAGAVAGSFAQCRDRRELHNGDTKKKSDESNRHNGLASGWAEVQKKSGLTSMCTWPSACSDANMGFRP